MDFPRMLFTPVIGDVSDVPTSVLIGKIVVNTPVTATGIVQRPFILPPMILRRAILEGFFWPA